MTLRELIEEVEAAGYALNAKSAVPSSLLSQNVMAAPLVLIPAEPPVEEDCRFIENYLQIRPASAGVVGIDTPYLQLSGYARIEGAAATSGAALVRLQFIRRIQ